MTPAAFLALEQELNAVHLERRDVIHGLLCALLARQHVVLLGPPGSGKSRLIRDLTARVQGRYFEWLLTRMSTPEELFGPISLQALEQDHYRRVTTGKLPEADIAYLDETFKGSSAILNTLLAVMNERVFHNDGQPTAIPLQMIVGASNELPEDREELGALWDRFLLRYVVDYVRDPAAFTAVLAQPAAPPAGTTVTLAALAQAQAAVAQVDVTLVLPLIGALRAELARQGLVVSDRRWHDALGLVRATAWLQGRAVADAGDLAILQHVCWQDPTQRATVAKAVLTLVSPYDQEAQDILDQALDAYQAAVTAPEDQQTALGVEANKKLRALARQLADVRDRAQQAGRPSARADQGLQQVAAWGEEVLTKCLKVS